MRHRLTLMLHHLALRTRDLGRLTEFYREVFGLVAVRTQPGYSTWLSRGDAVLMLEIARDDEPAIPERSREMFALRVTPTERAALEARLGARGVAIEERTEFTTYFRDPDGRRVACSTYAFSAP